MMLQSQNNQHQNSKDGYGNVVQGFRFQSSHRVTHNSVSLAPGDLKLSFILLGQCTYAQMTLHHTQINVIKIFFKKMLNKHTKTLGWLRR